MHLPLDGIWVYVESSFLAWATRHSTFPLKSVRDSHLGGSAERRDKAVGESRFGRMAPNQLINLLVASIRSPFLEVPNRDVEETLYGDIAFACLPLP